VHRLVETRPLADIAEVEAEAITIQLLPHLLLFEFIPAEDSNFATSCLQQLLDHRPAKRPGTSGDQDNLLHDCGG